MDLNKPIHNKNYEKDVLPCPFCGGVCGKDVLVGYIDNIDKYGITCISCHINMTHDHMDEVISNWNKRIDPSIEQLTKGDIKGRRKIKETFVRDNWDLYKSIINKPNSRNNENPDFLKFVEMARKQIGYSDRTISGDIFRSFHNIAKTIEKQISPHATTL